jgi:tripartite-type tricarboxylate transporter receptor subunit TctC
VQVAPSRRQGACGANGYTIFIHHMGMSTAPRCTKAQFDPLKVGYIGRVVDVPMTLLARKSFP